MSDEQRKAASERFKNLHREKNKQDGDELNDRIESTRTANYQGLR